MSAQQTMAYHSPYWLTFKSHPSACVEGRDEAHAKALGAELTGSDVSSIKRIPYPATPRLTKRIQPHGGMVPSFCFRPDECKGTSCPQNYSCTE
jgi:hypothetical protein